MHVPDVVGMKNSNLGTESNLGISMFAFSYCYCCCLSWCVLLLYLLRFCCSFILRFCLVGFCVFSFVGSSWCLCLLSSRVVFLRYVILLIYFMFLLSVFVLLLFSCCCSLLYYMCVVYSLFVFASCCSWCLCLLRLVLSWCFLLGLSLGVFSSGCVLVFYVGHDGVL